MKTYVVDIHYDDQFWIIHVPEIDRVTQAIRYRDIPAMATELIGLTEDLSDEEIHLVVRERGQPT